MVFDKLLGEHWTSLNWAVHHLFLTRKLHICYLLCFRWMNHADLLFVRRPRASCRSLPIVVDNGFIIVKKIPKAPNHPLPSCRTPNPNSLSLSQCQSVKSDQRKEKCTRGREEREKSIIIITIMSFFPHQRGKSTLLPLLLPRVVYSAEWQLKRLPLSLRVFPLDNGRISYPVLLVPSGGPTPSTGNRTWGLFNQGVTP